MNNSTNSMPMTMDMSMEMIPWLHFGNTDYLIFKDWRPSSRGAIAGACIGLFLFSILERCLAAYRRTQELRWRAKALMMSNRVHSSSGGKEGVEASTDGFLSARRQLALPFKPSHDIPRGVIATIQSTFSYGLMLVVMTFNGAYILSIILGLGVGEVLFGRMGRGRENEHYH